MSGRENRKEKVMGEKPMVIHNKSAFEILIKRDPDGWYYCDLPSNEDGSPVPVVVTRDFYFWFPKTNGIVWVDDSFQFAMDQYGDIIPVFLYRKGY